MKGQTKIVFMNYTISVYVCAHVHIQGAYQKFRGTELLKKKSVLFLESIYNL